VLRHVVDVIKLVCFTLGMFFRNVKWLKTHFSMYILLFEAEIVFLVAPWV
jgi:hypothetical protein